MSKKVDRREFIKIGGLAGPGYRIAPSALHNFRAIHRGDILSPLVFNMGFQGYSDENI